MTIVDSSLARRLIAAGHTLRRSFAGFPHVLPLVAAIVFGGILLLPGQTFANSHGFDAMRWMSEDAWGAMFVGFGLLNLIVLKLSPASAWMTVWPILLGFSFVSAGMLISSIATLSSGTGISTGAGIYGVIAIACFWAVVFG